MKWYVIQVLTGKENDVAGKLKEYDIKARIPKENRLIRSGGSWIQKEYTLFPGYVFLHMEYNAENYYRVKNLPGVIHFLGDSRSPSTLSHLEAEWIGLLTGADNAPIEPTRGKLLPDGTVDIWDGVLEKVKHRIIKVDKHSRKATVEITVCGEVKKIQLSIFLLDEELKETSGK